MTRPFLQSETVFEGWPRSLQSQLKVDQAGTAPTVRRITNNDTDMIWFFCQDQTEKNSTFLKAEKQQKDTIVDKEKDKQIGKRTDRQTDTDRHVNHWWCMRTCLTVKRLNKVVHKK